MKTPIYQLFGSENSLDIDVVFFVEEMPETIAEKLLLSKKYGQLLIDKFPEKIINTNLAKISNGYLIDVYKGTTDELNNALFYTYDLHEQEYKKQIDILLIRDINLKFLRSCRMILSFLSKTKYRTLIKEALNGDIHQKIITLERIDLNCITDFGKGQNSVEIKKTIAFQLGQILALENGKELYTKNLIIDYYPALQDYLLRSENTNFVTLVNYLNQYIKILKSRVSYMRQTTEYKYNF
jgi:hypothetical protein